MSGESEFSEKEPDSVSDEDDETFVVDEPIKSKRIIKTRQEQEKITKKEIPLPQAKVIEAEKSSDGTMDEEPRAISTRRSAVLSVKPKGKRKIQLNLYRGKETREN